MRKTIRNMWPLLLLGFLVNTAYSVMWPLTTIYLHNDLHLNLVTSGWILAAYSGCNVLGGYLGGVLGDRYSLSRVGQIALIDLIVDATVGLFWNDLFGYPVVLIIFGLLTGVMLTLITTMTARLSHADSRLFNLLYIFINVGLVAGTASIGFLFRQSLRPIFSLLLVCYAIALVLWVRYARIFDVPVVQAAQATTVVRRAPLIRLKRVTLIVLFFSLFLMWATYAQWMSNVSVYIQQMGMGIKVYSYLWVYNGLLLIVVQTAMMRLNTVRGLPWQIMGGLLAIGSSFLLLALATNVQWLFIAMTLLTVGEAVYVPSVPALINAHTSGNEGKYQGLVNAFSSLGKALGPVMGGWIIDQSLGYPTLFGTCMGLDIFLLLAVLLGMLPLLKAENLS